MRRIAFTFDANVGDRDIWLQGAQRAMERFEHYGKIRINKEVKPVYIDQKTARTLVANDGILHSIST